jgi:ATP-dependent DNA ligase
MALPLKPPIEPMLARASDEIPAGEGWTYEPKWDGFRAIVFRDGDTLEIQSRKQQPLARYFPELVERLKRALPEASVVDGEIIIPGPKGLDFDALLQRIHPAASRIAKLSVETPASFVAFDLLALGREDLSGEPFSQRRQRLVEAMGGRDTEEVFVTPSTDSPEEAARWFERFEGAGLDGVVAKRDELPYAPGERVMAKIKHARTADCVIGGWRKASKGDGLGSILLGLYDEDGVLHHVGAVTALDAKRRKELAAMLAPLAGGTSFGEGRTPGAPSRWAQGRDTSWNAVSPEIVVEVAFDHLQGDRFRHGAQLLRMRPDKAPRDCTYEQLEPPHPFRLADVVALARGSGAPAPRPPGGRKRRP